ncbi:TetR/AcrR family transcriptional regulator [Clostridium estertheticum]|uniref:TetR/AcrR family transcriptional regulator n=1 Tax=Clostridium estertheticum TaxID=238834 RepID=UPI001CF4E70D|nr:TetR/AcrR family transcriptional regulator [Clostridium estertheticum]MCB2362414.1 TetR/AcrR family transcriptional regulator [Clostridium estertheticum]
MKKDNILDAALQLFITGGFQGTPTLKIALKAGVSNGTLFRYFPNKQELINALYMRCKDSGINAYKDGLGKIGELKDKITYLCKNAIEWVTLNKQDYLFFQQFENSPYINTITKEEVNKKMYFLTDIIEEGKRQKLVKQVSTNLILDIIFGIIYASMSHYIENIETVEVLKYTQDIAEFVWDSIKI